MENYVRQDDDMNLENSTGKLTNPSGDLARVLSGQWRLLFGVPQGSVLGPPPQGSPPWYMLQNFIVQLCQIMIFTVITTAMLMTHSCMTTAQNEC